jgi:hypothetical protein
VVFHTDGLIPSEIANSLLVHFPGILARFIRCREVMKARYGIEPMYGLFWQICINWGGEREIVDCSPHVDAKNLAIGVCVIFVYGVYMLCPVERARDIHFIQATSNTTRRAG